LNAPILTIVVGPLIFLLLGLSLPTVLHGIRQRFALRLARHVFPLQADGDDVSTIHIRASLDEIMYGTNPETLRGYTHSGDMLGVMSIVGHFDLLPVELEFDYFDEIRDEMKNVVLLGASSRSAVSRELTKELYNRGIRVRGENRHAFFRDPSGKNFHCEHAEVGGNTIVSRDVGVIFRKISDNGTTVLLCGGIHTFGSQAAAEIAVTKEFQRFIKKRKIREFAQLVTVDVITSGDRAGLGILRHTIRWKNLPLIKIAND
jgi:hypothetical protein